MFYCTSPNESYAVLIEQNDLFKNMATSKGTKYLAKIQVIHNKNIYQARKALLST